MIVVVHLNLWLKSKENEPFLELAKAKIYYLLKIISYSQLRLLQDSSGKEYLIYFNTPSKNISTLGEAVMLQIH